MLDAKNNWKTRVEHREESLAGCALQRASPSFLGARKPARTHSFFALHLPFFILQWQACRNKSTSPWGTVATGNSGMIMGCLQLMNYFICYTAENSDQALLWFSGPSELESDTSCCHPRHGIVCKSCVWRAKGSAATLQPSLSSALFWFACFLPDIHLSVMHGAEESTGDS